MEKSYLYVVEKSSGSPNLVRQMPGWGLMARDYSKIKRKAPALWIDSRHFLALGDQEKAE